MQVKKIKKKTKMLNKLENNSNKSSQNAITLQEYNEN